jgi:hypothetical protein
MTNLPFRPPRKTEVHDRRHRRTLRWALLASVLVHLLVLLLFRGRIVLPESPYAAAGERRGDARAAAGGGTQVVALQFYTPPPVVQERVPIPTPVVEVRVAEPALQSLEVKVSVPALRDGTGNVGQGQGRAAGEGVAEGRGQGDGGTADAGLFRVLPPSPRGLILPPSDRPGKVRGKEVAVWVFVTVQGRVVADSTRVDPTSGDSKFDARLMDQAAEWVFSPAKRNGQPVAEWFRYVVIL